MEKQEIVRVLTHVLAVMGGFLWGMQYSDHVQEEANAKNKQ